MKKQAKFEFADDFIIETLQRNSEQKNVSESDHVCSQGCQMWYISIPKISIWVNFGGPWNEKYRCMICSFGNFGIIFSHLAMLVY
jgi:hypothetical protein